MFGLASTRALVIAAAAAASASAERVVVDGIDDLTALTIDELAQIQVVSVSRRPEARIEAAGAVHVITGEDIRRSGVTTLPEAMRLSPGVQASWIDADEWALAVRGFASRLSRSVLVTLDGRSLWTPLFAGVFWDQHDTSLLDLDRIEVSRGPNGALFGANAFNGVISVITKRADETHGGLANLGIGTAEQAGTLRYGGEPRPGVHYRAWGQYRRRDGTTAIAESYDDEWTLGTGGARVDILRDRDSFTVQGDLYDGAAGTRVAIVSFTPPFTRNVDGDAEFSGGNVLGRWRRAGDAGDRFAIQAYYDRTEREEPHYRETRDTVDLDGQYRLSWGSRSDMVWGANVRKSRGRFRGIDTLRIEPEERTEDIASLFAQNELRGLDGRLRLTAGAKAEWNDYSGWHLQPSARIALLAGRSHLWAAASRAVRTSSRVERDIDTYLYASPVPGEAVFARVQGSDDFLSETVTSFEAGYKARVGSRLYFDVAGFHSVYDDLASNEAGAAGVEAGTPPQPPRVVVPVTLANLKEGSASGVETAATLSVRPGWRLQGAHSYLLVNQTPKPGSTDRNEGFEGNSPRHQVWAASYLTVRDDTDVDVVVRRVGEIATHRVDAFTNLDARLAHRPSERLELALVGQNLLHRRRAEFGGGFQIDRAVRARVTVRW